jgi:hypothetical protein
MIDGKPEYKNGLVRKQGRGLGRVCMPWEGYDGKWIKGMEP